jgi:hypothetical protein
MSKILKIPIIVTASWVGMIYLLRAYKLDSVNDHYQKSMEKMGKNLVKYGFEHTKNPYKFLISPRNKENLLHNLPHMQNLLDVAIHRTNLSVKKINESIKKLRR